MTERELTAPVSLTLPNGKLNQEAVGFARAPLVRTDGIGRGASGWGRNKRWEYWCVVTPTHIFSLTTSALDYSALQQVWVLDRRTLAEVDAVAIAPLTGSVTLPGTLNAAATRSQTAAIGIQLDPGADGIRLRAQTARVAVDITAAPPAGDELLAVTVPWSTRLFQYTVKQVGIPVTGTLTVDGVAHPVPSGSWAALDHARGRWPYRVAWQWGVAFGSVGGHRIGLQLGGTWTRGTGTTENGAFVDGRLHKFGDELQWDFDRSDYLRPWTVAGERIQATFTPFVDRRSRTDLAIVAAATDQCFGHWTGSFAADNGATVGFEALPGWAEDVYNRW